MDKSLIAALLLFPLVAFGQTHTMPGSNVVPSGASLTIQSGGTLTAAGGSTITGFPGGGNVSNSGTPSAGQIAAWTDATHIQGIANTMSQWDGGATGLTAATGRTSLGGTTVGQSFFTLANPGAVSFPEISAGNAVSAVSATTMRTDLGLAIGTNVQAFDTDLTTWAGITPVAAVGTWIATPNSANLRSAMTDENGTGALLFSGATTPDFTTGFTIGAAAASGKIPIGNGTNYVPSTPTWPTTAGTAGYLIQSNGTNFVTYPTSLEAASTATVSAGYAADTYLAGSTVTIAAGDWKVQGVYHCKFDMTKTGAGAATPIVTVRMGTLGTTGDASIGTLTWAVGTGVVDTGVFDIDVVFRSVGSGTSAVIQMMGACAHHLAATGLTTTGASGMGIIVGTSAGFNSTTPTKLGISFNGGSSFSGTNTIVTATLHQP